MLFQSIDKQHLHSNTLKNILMMVFEAVEIELVVFEFAVVVVAEKVEVELLLLELKVEFEVEMLLADLKKKHNFLTLNSMNIH